MKNVYLILLSGLMLCMHTNIQAQEEIEEFLERYAGNDADKYVQPLADAIGANFNSGWIHTTDIKKMKFQLYFGIITQTAFVPDKQKTFTATTPSYFNPESTVEASTILGPPVNVTVDGANGTAYTFPGGVGASLVPIATPQITVGSVFGTQVSFRFYAFDLGDDLGDVSEFGWGIRHSISQWFGETFPVGIVAGYFNNKFDIDDLKTDNHVASIFASWRIGVLELYGGPGYEWGSFEFTYESTETQQEETIEVDHGNSIRFTVGATLHLGVFTMNFDYNAAKQQAISAGIGVGFGKTKKK